MGRRQRVRILLCQQYIFFQGCILMLFPEKDVHLAIGFPVIGPRQEGFFFSAAADNYRKLNTLIDGLTEKELTTEFDFAADEKKKEAHWKRDKNLRDVLIHLHLMSGFIILLEILLFI